MRCTVVDESALISANIDKRHIAMENVVLQPHPCSSTIEMRKALGKSLRDNPAANFAG
jgi:lactate dehydrogenase-like 2-hydroxyacid dehydrogenase